MTSFPTRLLLILSFACLGSNLFGQVKFNLEDTMVEEGEEVCLDITVEDFTDILTLQFSINWDPSVLTFVRTENYGIPLNPGDFNTVDAANGKLSTIWIDPGLTPRTVADGQVLFSICFQGVGDPGSNSTVRFTDDPTMMDAIDGMDQSVGITAQEALVEVIEAQNSEDALEIYYDDIEISQGESFCVPIRVRNFVDLTAVQFSLKFNNNRFRFDQAQNEENWGGAGFVAISTNNANTNGEIGYAYIDFSVAAGGNTSTDGDAIFEICLTHILNETCVLEEIIISSTPTEILATKAPGDFEVPVVFTPGKIRMGGGDPLVLDDAVVEGVDCRDGFKGSIDLSVSGGTAAPRFLWSNGEETARIQNLAAGSYSVSISDECLAVDTLFANFIVDSLGQMPIAEAGGDQTLVCDPDEVILNGNGSSSGSNFVYTWSGIDGQSILSGTNSLQATVNEVDRFEISVENTVNGCIDRDTVNVIEGRTSPSIAISGDNLLDCDINSITLTGVGTNSVDITYDWSTTDGEFTILDKENISVTKAGTYTLFIQNILNRCTATTNFTVTGSSAKPQASITGAGIIDCNNPTRILNANNGSGPAPDVLYAWTTPDGSIVQGENDVEIIIDRGGTYNLRATNSISGCFDDANISIVEDLVEPTIMINGASELGCDVASIILSGNGSNGDEFTYDWSSDDGSFNTIDKENISVTMAGTYSLMVTNTINGCSTSDNFTVSGSSDIPQANINGSGIIDCNNPTLVLDGNDGGGAAPNTSYAWTTPDGSIVQGENDVEITIDQGGTYNLRVTNTNSGCFSDASITISEDLEIPTITISGESELDCNVESITLTGNGTNGDEFTYDWSTSDGSFNAIDKENISVVSSGTYTLQVLNTRNGCSISDDFTITGSSERPQASISGMSIIDCNNPTLTLNANNGSGAAPDVAYAWSTTDGIIDQGENDVEAIISQSGTYNVRVTNINSGCFDEATLSVTENTEKPTITNSADLSIDCANEISNLNVSSTDTNLNFQWNVIEGNGQILSGSNANNAEILGAGKFEIVASNPLNGCSTRDTTTIVLLDILLFAEVGDDFEECNSVTTLTGNIEDGLTGMWTVIAGSGMIDNPTDQNATASNLGSGENKFVWTLSSTSCPDYSSDTITVNLVPEPIAQDDSFEASQGFGTLNIDLLANDLIEDRSSVVVTILSMPSMGTLTETGIGIYTYEITNQNAFGTFSFQYEVCDGLCSMNCSEALVTINVRSNVIPMNPEVPSTEPQSLGITPNGDGLNEYLIFDELDNNPEIYQTRRLLVYNRWGDVVHDAQPYQNDWNGTGKAGNPLPQGTYYFVMQLDIGRGLILEGDVTILK